MTDRFFIGAPVNRQEDGGIWGHSIARPEMREAGAQFKVLSPDNEQSRFLPLYARFVSGDSPHLHAFAPEARIGDAASLFAATNTALLVPIGEGSPFPPSGFLLTDHNLRALHRYAPPSTEDPRFKDWPDWRFELAARGLAFFLGQPASQREKTDGHLIKLGDVLRELPPDAREAWLNPLAVSFRAGTAIPGLQPGERPTTDFARAIHDAQTHGVWTLAPRLSEAARRRFVGWRALLPNGGKPSLLRGLFEEAESGDSRFRQYFRAPLADLAALDDMQGAFHSAADGASLWRWAPPQRMEEREADESQLCAVLLDALGLEAEPDPAPDLPDWQKKLPEWRPQRETALLEDVDAETPVWRLFEAASETKSRLDQTDDLLSRLASAAKTLSSRIPQAEVAKVFEPLQENAFSFSASAPLRIHVDMNEAHRTIAEEFFKPRSRVGAAMTGPQVDADSRADFDAKWEGKSIDLFRSPRGGAIETLAVLTDPGLEAAATDHSQIWHTAFWRHCVGGDGSRFRLVEGESVFKLDLSRLDGPAALGGGDR